MLKRPYRTRSDWQPNFGYVLEASLRGPYPKEGAQLAETRCPQLILMVACCVAPTRRREYIEGMVFPTLGACQKPKTPLF